MQKLGMVYDRSSSYNKNDGSASFESDVYVLKMIGTVSNSGKSISR